MLPIGPQIVVWVSRDTVSYGTTVTARDVKPALPSGGRETRRHCSAHRKTRGARSMVGFPYSGADVVELKWRLGRPSHRLLAGFVSRALVCNLAFACTMKE